MDRGKRALDWPPTADERKTKKPCCAYDPPTTTGGGSGAVPEISSLLSSLSVAKRHRPSAADDHHALKRPRHQLQLDAQAQILHAPMRGLEICCDETDMSSNSIRPPHSDDADWSSFLPELLRLICRRLPLADVPRFAAVCRHWSSCAFPVYPADTAPVLLSTVVTGAGSSVRCYHPCLHKMFVLATPPQTRLPQGSRVFSASADGCLMLRTARKTVLFAHLLEDGGSAFETPQREDDEGFMFCTPPQHGDDSHCGDDRKIFAFYPKLGTINIQSWAGGSWKTFQNGGSFFRMSSSCNPVMHRGKLYCLGEKGNLGVYDPGKTKWRVLRKPASFGSEFQYKNCYLVESQGELLAALTGDGGTPIHVLTLDEKKMKWKRTESLGGRSLFTGTTSSMLAAMLPQSMANKVFLPRFYGRPRVILAKLASSDGRLFFVANDNQAMPKDEDGGGGAWCYDLESESHRQFAGASCKTLLQYVWVQLGRVASPTSDDLMVIV